MGVISIVIGIINQLITGGAPPCMNDKTSQATPPQPQAKYEIRAVAYHPCTRLPTWFCQCFPMKPQTQANNKQPKTNLQTRRCEKWQRATSCHLCCSASPLINSEPKKKNKKPPSRKEKNTTGPNSLHLPPLRVCSVFCFLVFAGGLKPENNEKNTELRNQEPKNKNMKTTDRTQRSTASPQCAILVICFDFLPCSWLLGLCML